MVTRTHFLSCELICNTFWLNLVRVVALAIVCQASKAMRHTAERVLVDLELLV